MSKQATQSHGGPRAHHTGLLQSHLPQRLSAQREGDTCCAGLAHAELALLRGLTAERHCLCQAGAGTGLDPSVTTSS